MVTARFAGDPGIVQEPGRLESRNHRMANIVLWRGLAEVAEKYVRKGSTTFYIEGRIRTRSYGEENNKKWITEIVVIP